MDVDAYAAAHQQEWRRLEELIGRRRLTGAESDELVTLYQRTATHLSTIRSAAPDPVLVGRLSRLVATGRSAVTGAQTPSWRAVARFFTVSFPAELYRARWWAIGVSVVSVLVAWVTGVWVAGDPAVQASIASPEEIRRLVEQDFESYYSSNPAGSFAAQVWTNNVWVAAICLVTGIFLLPVAWILLQNVLSIGVNGGLMAGAGRLDLFFGLILPHGMLELTAVFVAAAAGLRLGWTLVDPGPLPRTVAVAAAGRATVGLAMGITVMLLVSGLIEAFVTPSGLPTWARIGIGAVAELAFLAYVAILGRKAAGAGGTGDVLAAEAGDRLPTAG